MNEIEKALVVYDGVYNGIGNYPYYDLVHTALKEKLTREQNEPLTLEELKGMDGEPVWRYDTIKKIGGWEIFTLDDDGNWYFVSTYLAQGKKMNDAAVMAVKNGKIKLYKYKFGGDMMAPYKPNK